MANLFEFSFSSLLPFALFFLSALIAWFSYASFKQKKHLPPSIPGFPVVGNLFQLGTFPYKDLQALSRRYGPLMLVHFGRKPVIVASSADAAREIMKTQDLIFADKPKITIPDALFYGSKDVSAAPYGEYWRQVRSISVLHLLSNNRVQSFRTLREEETSVMIEKIMRSSTSSDSGAINLGELFSILAHDLVYRITFGRKSKGVGSGKKMVDLMEECVELLGTPDLGEFIPWLGWMNHFTGLNARIKKVFKEIDEYFDTEIEEHKRNGRNMGETNLALLDILFQLQKEGTGGFCLPNDSIKAILLVRPFLGFPGSCGGFTWFAGDSVRVAARRSSTSWFCFLPHTPATFCCPDRWMPYRVLLHAPRRLHRALSHVVAWLPGCMRCSSAWLLWSSSGRPYSHSLYPEQFPSYLFLFS